MFPSIPLMIKASFSIFCSINCESEKEKKYLLAACQSGIGFYMNVKYLKKNKDGVKSKSNRNNFLENLRSELFVKFTIKHIHEHKIIFKLLLL